MKISHQNKLLLFEQEFLTLLFMAVLGFVFYSFEKELFFYLAMLGIGFILYFWMIHEEDIHTTGKKHMYFEHTSSYIMVAQTALALQLLALNFVAINIKAGFFVLICMLISVIMYSVSLSRIFLFKMVFKDHIK